jgi:hypothetical protein
MLDAPSIVCRVIRPIVYPIVARPDEVLVVWPGHPTHTLTVCAPDGKAVLRWIYCADGALYGILLNLYLDAAIRCCDPESERSLLTAA